MLLGLIIAASLLPASAPAPARAAGPFIPVADSWIDESSPSTNNGTATTLRTDASPVRIVFLRFDLAGVDSVPSALLRVHFLGTIDRPVEIHAVNNVTWSETGITASNDPALGPVVGTIGRTTAGQWSSVDVSGAVTGPGLVTLAMTTTSSTSVELGSRESSTPPELHVPNPNPTGPMLFSVTRSGSSYTAAAPEHGITHSGSAKGVVESAVTDIAGSGRPGTIAFAAATFDLGSTFFRFESIRDVTFQGAGIDQTIIQNSSNASADTEPFNFSGATRVTIRDMTVAARGTARSTSDAIDFDFGNLSLVERVKITASRAKGIIFDGKNSNWTANGNTVRDCVITGVPGAGIELLAASGNHIEGCTITNVARQGIVINKASTSADQANKPSDDNTITGNTIDNAGLDGIAVNSSNRNVITLNTITNSSNVSSGRDAIRLSASDSRPCDDTVVDGNTATDTQSTKTQRYGLHIASSLCHRTLVRGNHFAGNASGEIRDLGSGTIFEDPDPEPDTEDPSVPGNVTAVAISPTQVEVRWEASTDNVGVTGYGVYRDGQLAGTVGASTLVLQDGGRTASTTYAYTVDAVDAATNRSAQSSPAVQVTTPPATSGSVTLGPVADTYVDASSPMTPRGTSTQLRVDGSPDLRAYLRFDVQGVTGTVTRATLRVWANSSSSTGHRVHDVASTTWSEAMLYADAPAVGAVAASSGSFSSGGYRDVDVTSLVAALATGNGLLSLSMTTAGTTAISYASREGANVPQLVVEFSSS